MRTANLACLLSTLLLSACQSFPEALDKPASLSKVTDAQQAQLATLLTDLSGQKVTLTDKVFAGTDKLVLERNRQSGSDVGRLATGRNMDSPRSFRLVENKGECLLLDEMSGSRHQLRGFHCQPI